MGGESGARTDVRDPHTGETMVLDHSQSADYRARRVQANPGVKEGARAVAVKILEKENEHGRVYVNPRTGYRMRVRDDEDLEARAGGGEDAGGGGEWTRAGNGASQAEEIERLRARLRELEGRRA